MSEIKIGENRFIPKGTKFRSIKNQTNILLDEDAIVEVKHTCIGSDVVFVEPKQLIFNMMGYIPTLIGRGTDEWELSYSKTLEYTVPEARF
jgi:hypothetical protein